MSYRTRRGGGEERGEEVSWGRGGVKKKVKGEKKKKSREERMVTAVKQSRQILGMNRKQQEIPANLSVWLFLHVCHQLHEVAPYYMSEHNVLFGNKGMLFDF